MQSGSQ